MSAFNARQIKLHLQVAPGWSQRAHTIRRTFKFDGFLKSIVFVNRIAKCAQKLNHHPEIEIKFDQVTLTLSTHDQGGITEKDFVLARQADQVFAKLSKP